MRQVPLLIVSDAPDQTTGLARITRDLARLVVVMPQFRVATLGLGGVGSSQFPWQQYHLRRYPNGDYEYGELSLRQVWEDFAGGELGIVFTIWDLSRMLWLARPEYVADESLRTWLTDWHGADNKLWSYVPIDATGPYDRLTVQSRETLLGIDRVLAYSPWARDVVARTLGQEEVERRGLDWMPHGLDLEVWNGDGSHLADSRSGVADLGVPAPTIGVVATNQARKDWGLVAAVCRSLADRGDWRFWWHVDTPVRYWNLKALVEDYGLKDRVEITTPPLSDRELACRYRQSSVTLHPGLGEGFGFPIFESLACGVPAIHGNYGGGASIMETCGLGHYLIEPHSWRLEGQYNCLRPVYEPSQWVQMVEFARAVELQPAIRHLDWRALGPRWQRWFLGGLGQR